MTSNEGSPTAQISKPTAWKPRWRTDPTARPSVSLYAHKEIGARLKAETTHTFTLPSSSEEDPSPTKFVCIFNHLKANPQAPGELWTRHHLDLLDLNLASERPEDPLPMFSETFKGGGASYEFAGWYEIESWELVKGGSAKLKKFIQEREESKSVKSAQTWAHALASDWATVKLRKAPEDVAKRLGDPMRRVETASTSVS
ncbi:hypothetical protein EVG20_g3732 [Dentipellis fragilis]|uniref:Uncharacterized protein n=1 Tax=Dentipellis fragilis TaxID=205917 RepID=A0A4Y9Z265_9AGAM|nr:hypothetical protein EVG20_g3732 [Dentipellis fragilis]